MVPNNWNKQSYKMFKDYLFSIKDDKYKEFHKSLVLNSQYEIIGIRLPEMRKIAKEISKTNIESYLNVAENFYYEEVMIQGLVISYIKDENVFEKYFTEHVKKIDNWALCDTFCNSIKLVRKYEEKYFKIALDMSLSEDEFISRTGLVIILAHFINEKNVKLILETLNKIKSEKFYINMAEAWLICELYIKFKEPTLEFIKNNNLNKFTHNKAISKIHDSYRVSVEEKEYLNSLRRK